MKRIYPTNIALPILVDDEDYEELNAHTWNISKNGYVRRSVWKDGKNTGEAMHRRIMSAPKGMDVDHIDQNRLNNQKANLRLATRSQNMANLRLKKKSTAHSKYKGVSLMQNAKLKRPWIAYIKIDYKNIYIGYFDTEEDAAYAYDQFAIQLFDDYSNLNVL